MSVICHEPDNRFLECALAASAAFIVTVNTAPGHFDRKAHGQVSVVAA
jgi:predicted nucleic acid-binding protein